MPTPNADLRPAVCLYITLKENMDIPRRLVI